MLGTALRHELTHDRDELVIATKGGLRMTDAGLVHDASPRWLRAGVEASLRALGIEHIDLYQVHWPDPTVPAAVTAGALGEVVAEGKIGHVGVSNYDATTDGRIHRPCRWRPSSRPITCSAETSSTTYCPTAANTRRRAGLRTAGPRAAHRHDEREHPVRP
jgi:aryl-alcohol dehydrogenase-like predicted oxidoreductase